MNYKDFVDQLDLFSYNNLKTILNEKEKTGVFREQFDDLMNKNTPKGYKFVSHNAYSLDIIAAVKMVNKIDPNKSIEIDTEFLYNNIQSEESIIEYLESLVEYLES